MYKILFISSWKSAGALATPKRMTFHLNTRPAFLSCGGQVNLPQTTAFIPFGFVPAFGNTLQGVFHVANTPQVVWGVLVDFNIVYNQSPGS